jgi:MoxR-like ATPase
MNTGISAINEAVQEAGAFTRPLFNELSKVIVGQTYLVERLVIGLLANGHVLLEGVPGLAKTLAVKSLANCLKVKFARLQFTPDMLPADVIGTQVYNPQSGAFSTRRGPIFANLVLADEINRAPAKVQSALLEAMQEKQVTIGDQTFKLDEPFLVLATQNPIEQEGTYPLPEAQLDRFMFNLRIDYPSHADEVRILLETTIDSEVPLSRIWTGEEMLALQKAVRQIPVPQSVAEYAVSLVQATRPGHNEAPDFVKRYLQWGAGPRASQYLALAGKAFAALDGRFNVAVEDIQRSAKLVLRHRLITNYRAEADHETPDTIIDRLLQMVTA